MLFLDKDDFPYFIFSYIYIYIVEVLISGFMLIIFQINEFVKLGGDQLVPYYADILGAILPCISDKEEKIRVVTFLFVCV